MPQKGKHFKHLTACANATNNRSMKCQWLSLSTTITHFAWLLCSSNSTDGGKDHWRRGDDNWWKHCWFATICPRGWCVPHRWTATSTSGPANQQLVCGGGKWGNVASRAAFFPAILREPFLRAGTRAYTQLIHMLISWTINWSSKIENIICQLDWANFCSSWGKQMCIQ